MLFLKMMYNCKVMDYYKSKSNTIFKKVIT